MRAVDRALGRHLTAGEQLLVGLSGGRDSVALLAAIVATGRVPADRLRALHVHHGLSPHADAWATFCTDFAASLGARCDVARVRVADAQAHGIEAAARSARYDALRTAAHEAGIRAIALAHHQDDQAETLLLQLLRGAGVHGLAAMADARDDGGVRWLRPLLDVPRRDVDAFVGARGLTYVDDDSNASDRHLRNALRRQVVPAIAALRGGYPATIARAAAHQAEAAQLADDLAAIDATGAIVDRTLDAGALRGLPVHRARNLLRHFLHAHGLRAPSTARLAQMLSQLVAARDDARVRLRHDGVAIGVHRGRVVIHTDAPAPYRCEWRGEAYVELPHGRLAFVGTRGSGVAAHAARNHALVVRPRNGGERLQPHPARPRRALKSWLQDAGMPAWQRDALPLLFDGDTLVAVPGIGVDVSFQARTDEPGYVLDWQPQMTPGR